MTSRARLRIPLACALSLVAACVGGEASEAGDAESATASSASSTTDASDTTEASDTTDASDTSGTSESGTEDDTGPVEPAAPDPGPDRYAFVGELVSFDASASQSAVEFSWDFGDGSAPTPRSEDPTATYSYASPGRDGALLTAWNAAGEPRTAAALITVTEVPTHTPHVAATVQSLGEGAVVLSPDSDELIVVGGAPDFEVLARHPTCDEPRTSSLQPPAVAGTAATHVWVACRGAVDRVERIELATGAREGVDLPRGSRPYAALQLGASLDDPLADSVWVSLQGLGQLARVDLDGTGAPVAVAERIDVLPDVRGLAALPNGQLGMTRWRSPDAEGQWAQFDPATGVSSVGLHGLAYDPVAASDTRSGGVPSYLDQLLVSPIGDQIAIPTLQANFAQGAFVNGESLAFDRSVRATVAYADWPGGAERFESRKQFDDRGLASAGVHSSRGDYLFLAMRGARAIERVDTFNGAQAGSLLDVGYAPSGLALSPDDRYLFVDAYLSRELVVYDVSDFDTLPQPLARVPLVATEPLSATELRGKQLFNDCLDMRLAKDSYIACAHCHLDGEADARTWDFTERGEGLRNTISLLGRGGEAHGPIHWSANFDEVQDFEHDIRGAFGGTGLMNDADFDVGTRDEPLGDAKAGISGDLDALAVYVASLDAFPRSPFRNGDGSLTVDAEAGRGLFESPALGCTNCHAGPRLTDSQWLSPGQPQLHDVGTLSAASGQRLGAALNGLDTPTLHGLWNDGPYLHDGAASDLISVLTTRNPSDAHGTTSQLSANELQQLVAYLLSLEG